MKPKLLYDFSVKENNTIVIKREFAADIKTVWDTWTKTEFLDKWWAPKPYKVETQMMDFREGGKWFYAMVSPEGEKHWCNFNYLGIADGASFRGEEVFCDDKGNIRNDLPKTIWANVFYEDSGITSLTVTLVFKTEEDLKAILDMGFKEGFEMCLGNLDELLEDLK